MTEDISGDESRWRKRFFLGGVGAALLALIVVLLLKSRSGPAPAADLASPPPPEPSPSPAAVCPDESIRAKLEAVLAALENNDVGSAQSELDPLLSAYAGLMDRPECESLAVDLLRSQVLVSASAAWETAEATGSIKQAAEALRLASLAAELAATGREQALATSVLAAAERKSALLSEATAPGRIITRPETIATERAGGLHPLCDVNSMVKPLLSESGEPVSLVSRIEVYSETLFVLAGGELMAASLEEAHGASSAVSLRSLDPGDEGVAGAPVGTLVDLARAENGDLLLLEKSGRLLRRTPAGDWSLDCQAKPDEMPVAVAPFGGRSYLLDPASNQVWRHPAEEPNYPAAFFYQAVIRDLRQVTDLAIDGAVYVTQRYGAVHRFYGGVTDAYFQPDTDLGAPAAIFLPDDPDSTLVYVVDGAGRRVLGLDRASGAYSLGFAVNVEEVGPLTSGAIHNGRLYLTDSTTLFISVLTPTPTPVVDCPALPLAPSVPFDRPELVEMQLQVPVEAPLSGSPSRYPGGRWPQIGYGTLDGLAFTDVPDDGPVRAIAPGTVSSILLEPPPLLPADMGVITSTGRVPAELSDALWGKQVWIDHGNGIMSRYGGLETVLPSLEEGQSVRRLTILGFAGQEPVFLGLWVDDRYLGYGRLMPETIAGYWALFVPE